MSVGAVANEGLHFGVSEQLNVSRVLCLLKFGQQPPSLPYFVFDLLSLL